MVGRIGVLGNWYNVECEGLHIICAQCWCYGHLLKDCPFKKPVEMTEEMSSGEQTQRANEGEKSAEEVNTGLDISGLSDMEQIKEVMHGEWSNVVC